MPSGVGRSQVMTLMPLAPGQHRLTLVTAQGLDDPRVNRPGLLRVFATFAYRSQPLRLVAETLHPMVRARFVPANAVATGRGSPPNARLGARTLDIRKREPRLRCAG
jgi:hypothetical protein